MKNNPQVVIAAVIQNADALPYASEDMNNNPQVVIASVTYYG